MFLEVKKKKKNINLKDSKNKTIVTNNVVNRSIGNNYVNTSNFRVNTRNYAKG